MDLSRLTNLAGRARQRAHAAEQRTPTGRTWYTIRNASSGPAEIYLYDMIGGWGITAQDFVDELRQVTGTQIDLHVNCEGGEVFDGIAIFAALAQHKATVTAYVDGLAASAASFIVQAGDSRVMGRHARMMIHDAHALCIGNAADMRDTANLLDDLSGEIASIYAERSGRGDTATWRQAMTAGMDGTWYNAQSAVDAGLADRVAESTTPGDRATLPAYDGLTSDTRVQHDPAAGPDDRPAGQQDPAPADDTGGLAWDPGAFAQATTAWPALIVEPEPDPGPPAINPYKLIQTVREATGR